MGKVVIHKYPSAEAEEHIIACGGVVSTFRNCTSATCNCSNHPSDGPEVTLPEGTIKLSAPSFFEDGYVLPDGSILVGFPGSPYDFGNLEIVAMKATVLNPNRIRFQRAPSGEQRGLMGNQAAEEAAARLPWI